MLGTATENVFKGNRATANGLHGFSFGAAGNVLIRNTVDENGVHGIHAPEAPTTLRASRANGNGFAGGEPGDDVGAGILATGATSSGNKASGNDDPRECAPAALECHVP